MGTLIQHQSTAGRLEQPLVSVVMTTFNVEAWVGKALDSVLSQKVSFPIEIVVSDDCSKDGTLSIIRAYERTYPSLIRVIAHPENIGMQRNYFNAFQQSRGKYIAWLDSDDYWTDHQKLQLQIEEMEKDPIIAMCGHYVRWVARGSNNEVKRERYPEVAPGRHGLSSVLERNFMPSPSIVFRNGLQRQLPGWYFDVAPLADWPLHVIAALNGDILLLDRVMADYTLNITGTFWGKGQLFWYQEDLIFYEKASTLVPREFQRQIQTEKARRYRSIAHELRKQGDFAGARRAALEEFLLPAPALATLNSAKALLGALVREARWRLAGGRAVPEA
jgi:glycosyltransferase involved in cell wall biosynthesis